LQAERNRYRRELLLLSSTSFETSFVHLYCHTLSAHEDTAALNPLQSMKIQHVTGRSARDLQSIFIQLGHLDWRLFRFSAFANRFVSWAQVAEDRWLIV
jgi:hypothetical protein